MQAHTLSGRNKLNPVLVMHNCVCCSAARNHGRKDVGLPSRLASFDDNHTLSKHKQSWWRPEQATGVCCTSASLPVCASTCTWLCTLYWFCLALHLLCLLTRLEQAKHLYQQACLSTCWRSMSICSSAQATPLCFSSTALLYASEGACTGLCVLSHQVAVLMHDCMHACRPLYCITQLHGHMLSCTDEHLHMSLKGRDIAATIDKSNGMTFDMYSWACIRQHFPQCKLCFVSCRTGCACCVHQGQLMRSPVFALSTCFRHPTHRHIYTQTESRSHGTNSQVACQSQGGVASTVPASPKPAHAIPLPAGVSSDAHSTVSTSAGDRHTHAAAAAGTSSGEITVRNVERRHWAQPWRRNSEQLQEPVCSLDLPDVGKGWKGPRLRLSLPSFRCASIASSLI